MEYGLALGGGGARGAAHVGVLMALAEQDLLPDVYAGTSAGSIIAGCMAAGMEPEELKREVEYLRECGSWYLDPDYMGMLWFIPQMLDRKPVSLQGFLKGNRMARYLCRITEGKRMEEAKRGILIPAVDINSGRTVVYTNLRAWSRREGMARRKIRKLPEEVSGEPVFWEERGILCDIMMASSSVPGVFRPRELDGRMLVDGGVTNNLPVELLAAAGISPIISVDIGGPPGMTKGASILDVVPRAISIRGESLERCHAKSEALTLRPRLPEGAGLLDFSPMLESLRAGYDCAVRKLPAIRRVVLGESAGEPI